MDYLLNLKRKIAHYKEVLANTTSYREVWKDSLKKEITDALELMSTETGLAAKIEVKTELENLEAIVLSLGDTKSGMFQKVGDDIQRHMIKNNGSLIYQQLFNGKVIVLINYPFIESYGKPSNPKTIGIYRPEELKSPFLTRHLEEFVTEITNWEDYDDDEPNQQKLGFQLNFQNGERGESEEV